jgi:two-component system chemotaxis response regulator CheB
VPILIVQHITPGFEQSLVEWLSDVSMLPVALASPGRPLRVGEVLVAPQGTHLGINGNSSVALTEEPPIGSHRPSASYLFRSVAETFGRKALGIILTGMGNDGVHGLAALKRHGGWVLAQDEATSAVYGMPREAVAMGVVDRILPVHDIPDAMVNLWRRGREPSPAPRDG